MGDSEAGPVSPRVPVYLEAWFLITEISLGVFEADFNGAIGSSAHILQESCSCAGNGGNA